jgi:hypothetical protein
MSIDMLFASGLLVVGIMGFLIGQYYERLQWNNLIHDGILPKPRGGIRPTR